VASQEIGYQIINMVHVSERQKIEKNIDSSEFQLQMKIIHTANIERSTEIDL
jgi:hypothetical protein